VLPPGSRRASGKSSRSARSPASTEGRSGRDITLLDSTGLAIQDLAIAKLAAPKSAAQAPPTAR
jgi:hypothetical protein